MHPAADIATGTLVQALAGRAAGGEVRGGRASSTASTATPRGYSWWRGRRGVHRALKAVLQRREITREYLALVEGRPPARSGTIDAPMGRDRRDRKVMSSDTDDPREAVTHFEIERALPGTHAAAGAPGDRAHAPDPGPPEGDRASRRRGPGLRDARRRYGLERQFLHAARLAFTHPVTGQEVDVRSDLPEDLRRASTAAAR